MTTLLITYDLNKAGQDYKGFYEIIRKYPYAKLSESSYAIQTQETPTGVYNKLVPHMDKNDHVYVVTLTRPYYGYGLQDVNNWLNQRL